MPKKVNLTYQKLLETVAKLIEEERFEEITARDLASILDVSVGKIYSFGKTKNEIVAEVVLSDWDFTINNIDVNCDIRTGLQNLYNATYLFTVKYLKLFTSSSDREIAYQRYVAKHDEIVIDIEKQVAKLSEFNNIEVLKRRNNFIAENILFYASKLRAYGDIEKILVWILTYNTGDLKAYGTFS